MCTFVWFSGAIWETPSKKTAVILSHLYVIGVKIVLRDLVQSTCRTVKIGENAIFRTHLSVDILVLLPRTIRCSPKFQPVLDLLLCREYIISNCQTSLHSFYRVETIICYYTCMAIMDDTSLWVVTLYIISVQSIVEYCLYRYLLVNRFLDVPQERCHTCR